MTSPFVVHEVQQAGRSISTIHRPTSVAGALRLLRDDPTAKAIAGGTDLLLDLQRGGPGAAVALVDLTTIVEFRSITEADDRWVLGGGVTHNQIVQHDALRSSALPLAQACLEVGSPQLRNRATIAGNLVTASPANDTISALMALGASVELSSVGDDDVVAVRTVQIDEFFLGFRQTDLQLGELITSIHVPKMAASARGIWVKLGLRKAQAISVVHAGLVVDFDGDAVRSARLALGSVAPTVVLVDIAEPIVGANLDADTAQAAGDVAAAAVAPITDVRATDQYRTDTISVLVRRALLAMANDAHASSWLDHPPTLSTADQLSATAPSPGHRIDSNTEITIDLNGTSVTGSQSTMNLLDWVRDVGGHTGMKEGCAEGECGACTMLLDGAAVMSCLVPAAQADGRAVSTVEGLGADEHPHPIQQAFVDDFAVQCGFCIPGFLVSGARLLDETDDPSLDQIQLGLSGNLCRCTGYYPIVQAVEDAAVEIRGSGS